MAKIDIIFDVKNILKWMRLGQETIFIEMTDFSELENILNTSNIPLDEDEE